MRKHAVESNWRSLYNRIFTMAAQKGWHIAERFTPSEDVICAAASMVQTSEFRTLESRSEEKCERHLVFSFHRYRQEYRQGTLESIHHQCGANTRVCHVETRLDARQLKTKIFINELWTGNGS